MNLYQISHITYSMRYSMPGAALEFLGLYNYKAELVWCAGFSRSCKVGRYRNMCPQFRADTSPGRCVSEGLLVQSELAYTVWIHGQTLYIALFCLDTAAWQHGCIAFRASASGFQRQYLEKYHQQPGITTCRPWCTHSLPHPDVCWEATVTWGLLFVQKCQKRH